jgi:hypothetical protein
MGKKRKAVISEAERLRRQRQAEQQRGMHGPGAGQAARGEAPGATPANLLPKHQKATGRGQ